MTGFTDKVGLDQMKRAGLMNWYDIAPEFQPGDLVTFHSFSKEGVLQPAHTMALIVTNLPRPWDGTGRPNGKVITMVVSSAYRETLGRFSDKSWVFASEFLYPVGVIKVR